MYSSRSSRLQSLGHTEARQSQGCPNFLSFRSPLTFFASIFNTFLGILSYDIIAYYHMISYASLHYLLSALSDAVWKHQTWHSFASKGWHGAGPTLALGDLVVTKRHGKEGGIFRLDPTQDATFKNPEASRAEHKSREKLKQMKWIFFHLWSQFILILQ
jgi:hypothetical protein